MSSSPDAYMRERIRHRKNERPCKARFLHITIARVLMHNDSLRPFQPTLLAYVAASRCAELIDLSVLHYAFLCGQVAAMAWCLLWSLR